KSTNMPWWKGMDVKVKNAENKDEMVHCETLMDALDKYVRPPKRLPDAPLRMPVGGIHNIKGVGTVITGRLEQGTIRPKDEVIFIPSHTATNKCEGSVFSIEMHHTSVPTAGPGDNVGLNVKGLGKEMMPKVGDIM